MPLPTNGSPCPPQPTGCVTSGGLGTAPCVCIAAGCTQLGLSQTPQFAWAWAPSVMVRRLHVAAVAQLVPLPHTHTALLFHADVHLGAVHTMHLHQHGCHGCHSCHPHRLPQTRPCSQSPRRCHAVRNTPHTPHTTHHTHHYP